MDKQQYEDFRRGWDAAMAEKSANICTSKSELAGYDAAHYYGNTATNGERDALAVKHAEFSAIVTRPELTVEADGDVLWA